MPDPRPVRVQMSRKKGWRKPENTIYVGRPTIWGNPHSGARWDDDECELGAYPTWRLAVVDSYRRWLADEPVFMRWFRGTLAGALGQMTGDTQRSEILRRLSELRGKNLACWCPLVDKDGSPVPCHADVLLELANA